MSHYYLVVSSVFKKTVVLTEICKTALLRALILMS